MYPIYLVSIFDILFRVLCKSVFPITKAFFIKSFEQYFVKSKSYFNWIIFSFIFCFFKTPAIILQIAIFVFFIYSNCEINSIALCDNIPFSAISINIYVFPSKKTSIMPKLSCSIICLFSLLNILFLYNTFSSLISFIIESIISKLILNPLFSIISFSFAFIIVFLLPDKLLAIPFKSFKLSNFILML